MHPVFRAHVQRLAKFLEKLDQANLKPGNEIELNELGNLMNKIGFSGPHNKRGSARGFSHKLLKSDPMLFDGQIKIDVVHGSKVEKIRYRDFKQYLRPHIETVLEELRKQNLIQEDDPNVQL